MKINWKNAAFGFGYGWLTSTLGITYHHWPFWLLMVYTLVWVEYRALSEFRAGREDA